MQGVLSPRPWLNQLLGEKIIIKKTHILIINATSSLDESRVLQEICGYFTTAENVQAISSGLQQANAFQGSFSKKNPLLLQPQRDWRQEAVSSRRKLRARQSLGGVKGERERERVTRGVTFFHRCFSDILDRENVMQAGAEMRKQEGRSAREESTQSLLSSPQCEPFMWGIWTSLIINPAALLGVKVHNSIAHNLLVGLPGCSRWGQWS